MRPEPRAVYISYNAIAWAYNEGVTSGTSATTFAPSKTLTRAEGITFLYKARDLLGIGD